ncbi:MAG TPA: hypothetical protein VEP90_26995 [Methylomirabilota bacterium]|nr:hypothetical protein [Methylomirabilota bacterium]
MSLEYKFDPPIQKQIVYSAIGIPLAKEVSGDELEQLYNSFRSLVNAGMQPQLIALRTKLGRKLTVNQFRQFSDRYVKERSEQKKLIEESKKALASLSPDQQIVREKALNNLRKQGREGLILSYVPNVSQWKYRFRYEKEDGSPDLDSEGREKWSTLCHSCWRRIKTHPAENCQEERHQKQFERRQKHDVKRRG